MNFVFSLFERRFLAYLNQIAPAEVLLYPYRYSKGGKLTLTDTASCIEAVKAAGHRAILCVDVLLSESQLPGFTGFISDPVLHAVDGFRFLDPGVGRQLSQIHPTKPIQQSLERSSLNLPAVLAWQNVFGRQLERQVLSAQLPLNTIRGYAGKGHAGFELLGIGPLEIFYSARNLLNPDAQLWVEDNIKSTERPGSLFSRIMQTPAGTLMFFERLLFIADMQTALSQAGIDCLRYDFWNDDQWQLYLSCRQADNSVDPNRKDEWGKVTRGFINANKTDAQFRRLTNAHLRKPERKDGRVIEYANGDYLAVELFTDIHLPATVRMTTPEGRELCTVWHGLTSTAGEETRQPSAGIYLAPFLKFALTGTAFFCDPQTNSEAH